MYTNTKYPIFYIATILISLLPTYNPGAMMHGCIDNKPNSVYDNTALPAILINLTAGISGTSCKLTWYTLNEQGNKDFKIEHSTDNINWKEIGRVSSLAPDGNSSQKLQYSFIHKRPAIGKNNYRLKQIDFDETITYSKIVTATLNAKNKIIVYPNPSKGQINIAGTGKGDVIQVYNPYGQLVLNKTAYLNIEHINLESQLPGIYTIKITKVRGDKIQEQITLIR